MTNDSLSALKKLCGGSGLPCAVSDDSLRVLWRNTLAEKSSGPLCGDDLSGIFRGGAPAHGITCFRKDGAVHRLNVMKWVCPGDKQTLFLIEHLGSDDLGALLTSPPIKAYMTYLCGRIRRSMGMIAVSADELDSAFGDKDENVSEQLNAINRQLMLIFREVVDPEQLYCVIDPDCEDSTICVPDELRTAADDAGRALGRAVNVRLCSEKNVFARMNRSAFETVAAEMTAECCAYRSGESLPCEMVFSCESVGTERAAIEIKAIYASKAPQAFAEEKTAPGYGSRGGKLYYDYLCQVMCEKYGAVFTRQELPGGYMCRMEFSAIDACRNIVIASPHVSFRPARFNAMTLALAERHTEDRYGSSDISG